MSRIEDDPTLPDGGDPLSPPEPDETPRVLGGRYVLEERLGVGGGAVVWRAFDQGLSRTVAIKVLRPEFARDDDAVARLHREAATAGRIPHPGIVAVYDTGIDDGTAWLAIEHVAGPTLLEVLRHHPRGLPPQVAAAVAEQVAGALGHAHARGLVHRDVKPSNLLLSGDGVVKLADFGVAAQADGRQDPELAGSRGYAPPEQLDGLEGADQPPVDVFALGVVLHECLTGRPAFLGPTRRARAGGELLAPRQVHPEVPRDLDAVVRRATRTAPSERFPNGHALATALRPLVASDPFELTRTLLHVGPDGPAVPAAAPRTSTSSDSDTPEAGGRSSVSWRWVGALLAVLGLAAVLLATLSLREATDPQQGEGPVADVGVPVVEVELFDPYGSVGPGDPGLRNALDDDPDTAWTTPTYPVPLRSLGTPGVGIWMDVGEPRAVEEVELDLATGGVTVELLAADHAPGPGTTEADWRSLDRVSRPGPRAVLTADGEDARYWLVWFTELEPVGETWQASLTDLRFRPAGTP